MNLGAKLLLNWLAVVVGVLLSIILYRLQVAALGLTALGTWVALSSLCGYLSLLELGLGAAINKYSAAHSALRDRDREERLLSTALVLYLGLAALVLLGGFGGSLALGPLLRVPGALLRDGQRAMILLSLNIAASFVLCTWRGAVFGRGRTDVIAVLTISRHLLYAALVVMLLRRGVGFLGLAAAGLCADLLTGLCLVAFARRACGTPVRLRPPSVPVVRALLGYCSSVILIVAGQQLLRSGALPLLQRALGPEAVAAYAPADRLALLFFTLVGQMGMVMVPPVAAACAADPDAVRPQLVRAGRLGIALGLPPLCMLLLLGDRLIVVWLGPAMASSALYLRLLGIALLAQLVSFGTDIGAYAVGGRRVYSLTKLACGIGSLGLIQGGLRLLGAPGAAVGCGLAVALCDAFLTPLGICRALGLRPRTYYAGLLDRSLRCLALLTAAGLLVAATRPAQLASVLAAAAAGSALGWVVTYLTYLRTEDRALLRSRLHPAPRVMTPAKESV